MSANLISNGRCETLPRSLLVRYTARMPARLLSGTAAADALLDSLKGDVARLDPKLVIVQVGEDAASDSYIARKLKSCDRIGMRREHKRLPGTIAFEELMAVIEELNADDDVTGFIVQLPLPEHLWKKMHLVNRAIDPKKDVDGFTAYNLGKTFLSKEFEHLPPATPAGIILLLEHYGIDIAGKNAVIVGRSAIVGKPLSVMLLNRDATVTVCHSKTPFLQAHTRNADILVSAVGKANLITADMVKPGAVVIDVGMTRTDDPSADGKAGLVGDVEFEKVKAVASAITPVPGGVGPMTVASLLRNTVRAKKRQSEEAA